MSKAQHGGNRGYVSCICELDVARHDFCLGLLSPFLFTRKCLLAGLRFNMTFFTAVGLVGPLLRIGDPASCES